MRRLSFALFSPILFAASAFAADPGTYRPGSAYSSVPASSADTCDLQCAGDAQCRSWNFVRMSQMNGGVCEFNENTAAPVPSPVSISGENSPRKAYSSLVSGRTNTVRVGSPSVTQGRPAAPQPSSARRVIRQPVPAQIQPRSAAFRQTQTHKSQPHKSQPITSAAPLNAGHLSLMEQQKLNRRLEGSPAPRLQTPPRQQVQPSNSLAHNSTQHRQPQHAWQQPAPRQHAMARRPQQAPSSPPAMFRHNLDEAAAAERQQRSHQTQQQPASYAASQADPRLQQRLEQKTRVNKAASPQQQTQPRAPSPVHSSAMPAASYSPQQGALSAPPGVPAMAPSQQQAYAAPPTLAGQRPSLTQMQSRIKAHNQARAQYQAQNQGLNQAPHQGQTPAQAQAVHQRRVYIPNELSPRPMGAAEATDSLFGSLYDDVKVPAQIDPSQINDPDAPIPTVTSVPTASIMSAPLPPAR